MKCKEGLTVLCLSFKALPNKHFRCTGDVAEMDQECLLRNIFCMQIENLRIARKEEALIDKQSKMIDDVNRDLRDGEEWKDK